jgi:hypothetical protein
MLIPFSATTRLTVTLFDWASLLFGGIGVALLGWLARIITHRQRARALKRQQSTERREPPKAAAEKHQLPLPGEVPKWIVHSGPRPLEIRDAIVASPPYSRELIAENFVGTSVDWTLELRQLLLSRDRRIASIRLDGEQRYGFPIIECKVELENYGLLKFVHEGTILRISGTITKATSHEIFLGPPHFTLTAVEPKLLPEKM